MEYDRDLIFHFLLPFLALVEDDKDGFIFWPAETVEEWSLACTGAVGNVKIHFLKIYFIAHSYCRFLGCLVPFFFFFFLVRISDDILEFSKNILKFPSLLANVKSGVLHSFHNCFDLNCYNWAHAFWEIRSFWGVFSLFRGIQDHQQASQGRI